MLRVFMASVRKWLNLPTCLKYRLVQVPDFRGGQPAALRLARDGLTTILCGQSNKKWLLNILDMAAKLAENPRHEKGLSCIFGSAVPGPSATAQAQFTYTNADGSIYDYSTNADGTVNITNYVGPPWVVAIPTNINGLTVTSIGEDAFYGSSLSSITIPNGVTSIGVDAFFLCGSLTNVTIPDSVTSIGDLFEACSSLASITIPASVTSIGHSAFEPLHQPH